MKLSTQGAHFLDIKRKTYWMMYSLLAHVPRRASLLLLAVCDDKYELSGDDNRACFASGKNFKGEL